MNRLLKLTVLGLVALCLSLYGYLFWSRRTTGTPGSPPAPSATRESVPLWDAYERARTAVQDDGAAHPLSASAQWQAATEEALLGGPAQWSFKFYAPESSRVLDVVVTREAARVAKRTHVSNARATLAEGAWLDGPRDPLLVFLARGGRDFLEQHPQAVVTLHLAAGEGPGPRWDVAAVALGDRSVIALRIDAESLHVLSTASGPGEAGEGEGL